MSFPDGRAAQIVLAAANLVRWEPTITENNDGWLNDQRCKEELKKCVDGGYADIRPIVMRYLAEAFDGWQEVAERPSNQYNAARLIQGRINGKLRDLQNQGGEYATEHEFSVETPGLGLGQITGWVGTQRPVTRIIMEDFTLSADAFKVSTRGELVFRVHVRLSSTSIWQGPVRVKFSAAIYMNDRGRVRIGFNAAMPIGECDPENQERAFEYEFDNRHQEFVMAKPPHPYCNVIRHFVDALENDYDRIRYLLDTRTAEQNANESESHTGLVESLLASDVEELLDFGDHRIVSMIRDSVVMSLDCS